MRYIFVPLFLLHFYAIYNVLSDVTEYNDVVWKQAADFLLEGYDQTAEPCEDFVKHACGKWVENEKTREHSNQGFGYAIRLNKNLAEAIEKIDLDDEKTAKFKRIVKNFYNSCLKNEKNSSTSETKKRMKTLYDTLSSEIGTPPILSTDKSAKEKLLKENFWHLLGRIHRVLPDANVFFKVDGKIQKVDCIGNVPLLLMLPISEQKSDITGEQIEHDFTFLTNVLGIKIDEKQTKQKVGGIIKFQHAFDEYINQSENYAKELAHQELQDEAERQEPIYSLEELMAYNPNVSWIEYFQGLLTKEQFAEFNQSQPLLVIPETRLLDNVEHIARRFDTETVFNYIFWKSLRKVFILANISSNGYGKSCVDIVKETFKPASVRVFLDHMKYDAFEIRYDMELIAQTVFSAFKFLLAGAEWLDAEEKMELIRKVDAVTFYAGIPDWIMNDTEIDKRTDDLDSKGGRLIEDVLIAARNKFKKNMDLVVGITDANSEAEPSLEQNAYYVSMTVNFWLGILLPPFYHPKYPLAAKFAYAGGIVGHELLHGFDVNNFLERPKTSKTWLKQSTMKEYFRKVECVNKQYSSYCFKKNKKCINGRTTIGENMADIDGVKVAYMAYKFATLTTGPQPPLPGLTELSGDELFFLFSARCRCSAGAELEWWLRNNDNGEPHPPDESRYVVPFRNFPVFAKTFNCPVNSDFDPTKICSIWGQYLSG